MQKHRVYYGRFENDHYFVEIKKGLFDEWSTENVRNVTHRHIVKWRLRERERRARVILMTFSYIKQGCGNTLKLLKTVDRKEAVKNVGEKSLFYQTKLHNRHTKRNIRRRKGRCL